MAVRAGTAAKRFLVSASSESERGEQTSLQGRGTRDEEEKKVTDLPVVGEENGLAV